MRQKQSARISLVAVLLAASGSLGCAMKIPLSEIRTWPVEQRAVYFAQPTPLRILVLPFTDSRPRQEHIGQQAKGMILLVWNQRKGDYITNDLSFGGRVAEGLTDQFTNYLQQTNVFAQVVPAKTKAPPHYSDPIDIKRAAREEAADYVLTSDIQHFYGSQNQESSFYFLPLFYVAAYGAQNNKGLPWGKTTIQLSLYDGKHGDLVWRKQVEATRTLPTDKDSMSAAAMESFFSFAEQAATELRRLNLQPPDGSSSR